MTIQQQSNSITVAGTGIQTLWNFPFVGVNTSDITVSSVATNGSVTLLSPTSYTVNINPPAINQVWGIGGSIIYPTVGSPLPVGQSLIISRVLPYSQQITTQNQGNYYAQVTEQALDTLEMQIQQLASRTTQFRGIWITGTLYNAGDIVQDGVNGNNSNNYYICAVPNTSGVWVTDLAAGDWTLSALASVPTGNLTLTGDVTGTGASPIATTLATVNSTVGTFSNARITVNAKGLVTAASAGSTGSGTVTSITFTGDGTVLSSTPSSPITSSGTIAGTLLSQAKNTVLAGPISGVNAAPTYRAIVAADLPGTTFTQSYNSGTQTYSSGGTLTLAHSLGVVPRFISAFMTCISNDQGYTAGQVMYVPAGFLDLNNGNGGMSVLVDATNLYVKFGSGTGGAGIGVVNNSTGGGTRMAFANWNITFEAYA